MSVLPPPLPTVAKVLRSPEVPMVPSGKTLVPAAPSCVKLPMAVLGANPAIRLGVSGVQSGVNGLGPLSFVVLTETTGEATLADGVPPTVMAPKPVQALCEVGTSKTNFTATTLLTMVAPPASIIARSEDAVLFVTVG